MTLFKKLHFNIFSFISIAFFIPAQAWSAACCGGSSALPSLITGDDKALISASIARSRIDTDVYTNGIWQKRKLDDESDLYKIDVAHIISDRTQAGLSLPIQARRKEGDQGGKSSGLADVSTQFAYEYLPDWDYNPYRPKGIGFISLTLPTGKSIDESTDGLGLDSRGRGFWALGVGTILTKSWVSGENGFDVNSVLEVHRALAKHTQNSLTSGTLRPGTGGTISVGSGYNIHNIRVGANLSWFYEDPVTFDTDSSNYMDSSGAVQRFATGSLSSSYLFTDNWSATLTYADQTLFGDPTNTTLAKSLSLMIQKRWLR